VKNHHSGTLSRAESSADSLILQNRATRVIDRGLGVFPAGLESHGVGVGRWMSGGDGAALASHIGEADRSGEDEVEKAVEASRGAAAHKTEGHGRVRVKP
jgi:hypothetical protein